mmetsp:Transcript_103222/g.315852  ORF Transcript_103222/g.315852 Transcript_103222/m.315852 type:complete len:216 (+) Transcript_103222:572-1219(+)
MPELLRGGVLQFRVHGQDAHLDDDALEQRRTHRDRAPRQPEDAERPDVDAAVLPHPELVAVGGADAEPIGEGHREDDEGEHGDDERHRRGESEPARVEEAQRQDHGEGARRDRHPRQQVLLAVPHAEQPEAALGDDHEVPDEAQEHGHPHRCVGRDLQSRGGPASGHVADERADVVQSAGVACVYDDAQGPAIHDQYHSDDDQGRGDARPGRGPR